MSKSDRPIKQHRSCACTAMWLPKRFVFQRAAGTDLRAAGAPVKGVKVTSMVSATRGAMKRLFSVYVCNPSTPSTGAMVGSPLTPARLNMALVGDATTLCR